jgi:hypothetical protein
MWNSNVNGKTVRLMYLEKTVVKDLVLMGAGYPWENKQLQEAMSIWERAWNLDQAEQS